VLAEAPATSTPARTPAMAMVRAIRDLIRISGLLNDFPDRECAGSREFARESPSAGISSLLVAACSHGGPPVGA
jgi:hypothetical protein